MPNPNRSVIVIAGLLTVLVLAAGTTAVAFRNGWVQLASEGTPVPQTSNPAAPQDALTGTTAPADVQVYRQKLTEAYRALDEAYAQIRALQNAQSQVSVARGGRESEGDDDERLERRGERRERGER